MSPFTAKRFAEAIEDGAATGSAPNETGSRSRPRGQAASTTVFASTERGGGVGLIARRVDRRANDDPPWRYGSTASSSRVYGAMRRVHQGDR